MDGSAANLDRYGWVESRDGLLEGFQVGILVRKDAPLWIVWRVTHAETDAA
jgi:hypothetical protein